MPTRAPTFKSPSQRLNKQHPRTRAYQAHKTNELYWGRWRRYSKIRLLEHPLCVECEQAGRLTPANVTDHVIPHKGDERLFWDERNHQSLCKRCHDSKTAREDGGFGNLPDYTNGDTPCQ